VNLGTDGNDYMCALVSVCLYLPEHVYLYVFIYYRQHRGDVVGLAFSPDGEFMYSADSQGSLALYNASEDDHDVIRVVCMYPHTQAIAQAPLNFSK